jgi:UDP-N-acetylmuramoyl-L-alanyl-D-glutamate--2,6-diaminopimelate ligase
VRLAVSQTDRAVALSSLIEGLIDLPPPLDRGITGLCLDSRAARPGDLFLALVGTAADGRRYVADAIARGAVAVLQEAEGLQAGWRGGVPAVGVPDLGGRVGGIADRFYRHPSAGMWVAGVTGTNGKTTVSHLVAQALGEPSERVPRGQLVGLLGTLGYGVYPLVHPGAHTTPDAISVHRTLADFRDQGVRHTVMEVSSHALAQGRVSAVAFDVAVFTNLSRDHLDYHGDLHAYAEAKRRLFRFPGLGAAVVNLDDPVGRSIHAEIQAPVQAMGYSLRDDPAASVHARSLDVGGHGIHMEVVTPVGCGVLASPLLGRFNASNLLAALGVLLSLDLPLDAALRALARGRTVRGRMERFGGAGGRPLVVVDYAHTPDALAQVLATLREHCRGTLTCVFGCGGERDRGKRPEMGAVAERLADRVVLTDDNPRREDGARIVAEILAGLDRPDQVLVERDRASAIARALDRARADDVVLVAGKGHEDYQDVGGERRPFSDQAVVRALLDRGTPG